MEQRKTWWLVAAAVLALLIGTGVVLLRRDSEPAGGSNSECRSSPPPSAAPLHDTTGLEITEQGFSLVGADPAWVSAGLVLRNTTDRVAYRTLVTIDALDAENRTVIDKNHQQFKTQVVPILPPGTSVAVGNALAMVQTTTGGNRSVASLAITFAVDQWLDAGGGDEGLGTIETSVVPGSGERKADGNGSIAYTVRSTNCAEMTSRGVSMVFRDASGALIGGSLNNQPELGACEPGTTDVPGTNTMQQGIPADADLDRTTVTVYCDFDRPDVPNESGAPVN